jgi:hypothetical protein
MSVESSPRRDPAPLVAAFAALVVAVGVAWGVGLATRADAPPAAPPEGAGGVDADVAAGTTPTTGDPLHTPVGHHGEYRVQYDDLPARTQAELDVVREIIGRYPTAAAAERDGWKRATTNLRGIAAHFMRNGVAGFARMDATFDVRDPEILLFDGEDGDAPIVGVSYLASGENPEGFTGKWDTWHRHDAVCFAGGYVIGELGGHADSKIDMTQAECAAQGGTSFPISNLTMLHVWMKPGFESAHGVFSHDHPELD